MKKMKIKIVFLVCFFLLLLVPILYSQVCNYVCDGDWTGQLHHCSSGTIYSVVDSYPINYCVYHGVYPSSGTRVYDLYLVDQC